MASDGVRADEEAVPHGTIDPERLQAVLRRLNSGAYASPDVVSRIAAGVQRDLR